MENNARLLGAGDLKSTISVNECGVECPVRSCRQVVPRQRGNFARDPKFRCPVHGIYISPSTWEYEIESDNMLWCDKHDLALFSEIKTVKRESRVARDNSEDAVSWNVFRFLEKSGLVESVLGKAIDRSLDQAEAIYWSYNQRETSSWSLLNRAREEFGEELKRSSEPDIIIDSDDALIFVEAKLTAGNETLPSKPEERKKYLTGGDGWFSKVFRSEYEKVAIEAKKYELMRFWLLGTWMAEHVRKDFYLVNLVRLEREQDIEELFGQHIVENGSTRFLRWTWEDIWRQISEIGESGEGRGRLLRYFEEKTIGYNARAELQRAFLV